MGKVVAIILIVLAIAFLLPYIVLLGWNCARELWPPLPVATYHHAFWITNAIMVLFKSYGTRTSRS